MLQELVRNVASSSGEFEIHGFLSRIVHVLESVAEAVSVIIIAIGVIVSVYRMFRVALPYSRQPRSRRLDEYKFVRLGLARYLALALEFQLAADIIATSVAPSWDQLGRLGAIALIRTFLNYFLGREMAEEETLNSSLTLATEKPE